MVVTPLIRWCLAKHDRLKDLHIFGPRSVVRHHANDSVRFAAQFNHLSKDAAVTTKAPHPQRVRKNDYSIRPRRILLNAERASDCGGSVKTLKKLWSAVRPLMRSGSLLPVTSKLAWLNTDTASNRSV